MDRSCSYCKAEVRSERSRRALSRAARYRRRAGLGYRHLDRRYQRLDHRRQRAGQQVSCLAGVLAARRPPVDLGCLVAADRAIVRKLDDCYRGAARLLRTEPLCLPWRRRAATRGRRHRLCTEQLPLERTLSEIVDFSAHQAQQSAPDSWCRAREPSGSPTSTASRPRSTSSMCWLRVRFPRPFRPYASTASTIGTAASFPITAEAVFDDNPRRNFAGVHRACVAVPTGGAPTLWEVLHRQEDTQYSSRVATHIARQTQVSFVHVDQELAAYLPEETRDGEEGAGFGRVRYLRGRHYSSPLSPRFDNEDHTKDMDISPARFSTAWRSGLRYGHGPGESAPWNGDFDHTRTWETSRRAACR